MRVVGLDPGLRRTGWGVIEAEGNRLRHIANGAIAVAAELPLAERLRHLHSELQRVIEAQRPQEAAVEETLVNRNPDSTLKLGMARGIALAVPALLGLSVFEYLPLVVKKSIVGTGQASKDQVGMMVRQLLPGCRPETADAADALAIAICHAHHRATRRHWQPASDSAAVELEQQP